MLYGRRALRIGLLLCLLAAPWPALGASSLAPAEEGGWALAPSKTVSVFDDLAARPCEAHARVRPMRRTALPQSSRALSCAVVPVAATRPAVGRVRATRSPENRRDLHLRYGVLLI